MKNNSKDYQHHESYAFMPGHADYIRGLLYVVTGRNSKARPP